MSTPPDDGQMELVLLTPDEWQDRSKSLGAKVQEYKRIEAQGKKLAKQLKAQLQVLRQEIDDLADNVVFGKEWRLVDFKTPDIPPQWDR